MCQFSEERKIYDKIHSWTDDPKLQGPNFFSCLFLTFFLLKFRGLTLTKLQIKPKRIPDPNKPGQKINDYWGPAQNMLADTQFLINLKTFAKDHIPAEVIKLIQPYLQLLDFDPQVVRKASKAAYGLCCWVRAMDQYNQVIKVQRISEKRFYFQDNEFCTIKCASFSPLSRKQ